jgi:hypothetical protein
MISSNYTSKAALRHAERQRLEIKIKALSFALWQSKKRHRELLGQMESQPPKQERPSVVGRPDAVNAIKRPRLPPTMIDDEKREHKRAYMRDYMRRRKALGDAFVFKQKQKRKKPRTAAND